MTTKRFSNQVLLGVVIILIGGVLLLQNVGVADVSSLFKWIPSLFILLGLWQLVNNGFRYWTGPLILMLGGLAFQLAALDVLEIGSVFSLWPLILIIIAISILFGRSGRWGQVDKKGVVDSAGRVNVFAMFGGDERAVTSQAFEGGEITTLFGGAELNLDRADVADKPAVLNVFAMFGGVTIRASSDWLIEREAIAIFGGIADKRRQRKMLAGEQPDLRLTGFVAFGGITVEDPLTN